MDGDLRNVRYNATFREITDIDDMLSDIRNFLGRYISDVCFVCGEIIGFEHHEHHHIRYYPEQIVLVHYDCHIEIHHTNLHIHLKPPIGDSKDFYNGVKKPDNWIESGIYGHELTSVRSARVSVYPRPNLNFNRAAITEIDTNYDITYRKSLNPGLKYGACTSRFRIRFGRSDVSCATRQ